MKKSLKYITQETKNILKLKTILKDYPRLTFKDDVDIIISKAIEIEKEKSSSLFNRIKKTIKKIKEKIIYIRNFKFKLKPALISITIIALLFTAGIFFILPLNREKIHIVKAHNNAFINGKKVLSNNIYEYDLKNKMDIKMLDGEMTLQIGNKSLVTIKKDTEIILKKNHNFIIDLKKGEIICKVKESDLRNKLIIRTGNAKFTIVGTIFGIKNRNDIVNLKVKEGKIELDYLNNSYFISANEMAQIKNNKVIHKEIHGDLISYLNIIEKTDFINNFSKTKNLYINSFPENSRIYKNGMAIGKTPLLLILEPDTKDNYVIYSEKFNLAEINFNKTTNNKVLYKLKRMTTSDLLWKYEFTGNLSPNPIRINNYLIVPGADGTIYKFDYVKKEIIWQFKTGIQIATTPLFYNNKIYVNSKEGFFYSLDFNSGKLIWKREIGRMVNSKPIINNGKIFLGNRKG